MSSHQAAADVPLPVSDEEDWGGYEQQMGFQKPASVSSDKNNRSRPEFQVSSIDSNHNMMRSIPKRTVRPNVHPGRRQQNPKPDLRQEEAPGHVGRYEQSPNTYVSRQEAPEQQKEHQQYYQERSGHGKTYDRGVDRAMLPHPRDPKSKAGTLGDKQSYYRPPAARGEPRAPSQAKEDA